jgi:hypothetical protein
MCEPWGKLEKCRWCGAWRRVGREGDVRRGRCCRRGRRSSWLVRVVRGVGLGITVLGLDLQRGAWFGYNRRS